MGENGGKTVRRSAVAKNSAGRRQAMPMPSTATTQKQNSTCPPTIMAADGGCRPRMPTTFPSSCGRDITPNDSPSPLLSTSINRIVCLRAGSLSHRSSIIVSISSSIPMAIAVDHWMAHQLLLSERDMVLTMTDKQGGALSTCSSSEIFINYVKGTSATRFGGDDHRGVALRRAGGRD